MNLGHIPSIRKTGTERFTAADTTPDITLLDYWSWAHSDLIGNTERGKLAEFIVASALGVHNTINSTWDSFDLLYNGKGIEVKSAAYLQSWAQARESYIEFSIRPTQAIIGDTGTYEKERKRQAHIYVFCHLTHKDKQTVNPLDLDQWAFYVVPTSLLNEVVPQQKKIAISFFARQSITSCTYAELRNRIDQHI